MGLWDVIQASRLPAKGLLTPASLTLFTGKMDIKST